MKSEFGISSFKFSSNPELWSFHFCLFILIFDKALFFILIFDMLIKKVMEFNLLIFNINNKKEKENLEGGVEVVVVVADRPVFVEYSSSSSLLNIYIIYIYGWAFPFFIFLLFQGLCIVYCIVLYCSKTRKKEKWSSELQNNNTKKWGLVPRMPSSSSRHSLNKVSLSFFLYTLYLFSFLLFFLTFFFLVSCFEMVVEEPLRGTFQVSIFVDLITSRLKHVSISLLQFTALISVNSLLFYCLVRVSVGR